MEDRWFRSIVPFTGLMGLECLAGLSGRNTIFPFYHVVSDQHLPHMKHLYRYRSEAQFEKDLEVMLSSFEPISITDYLEGGRKSGRKRSMVLSFDDGLAECHHFVAPLLKSKGIPAIFFLNNDFIDNRGLFYRYKASILVEYLLKDRLALVKAAEFLAIPEGQVSKAILMITHRQIPLLDALSLHVELDYAVYLRDQPVYMSSEQVKHLAKLGFHLGAHSMDHPEFFNMEEKKIEAQVSMSMEDIRKRFGAKPACFAFPFTSDGVPEAVIDELLAEGVADVVFGTAGLKRTGKNRFIQRIPMEVNTQDVKQTLKAEYFAYLLKGLIGKNEYFKGQ